MCLNGRKLVTETEFRRWTYKRPLDISDPDDYAEAKKAFYAYRRQTCGKRMKELMDKYFQLQPKGYCDNWEIL